MVIWSMQLIMISRIFALYPQSRKVLVFVVVCFIGELATTSVALALALNSFTMRLPRIHLCVPRKHPKYFYMLWTPILCFEFILFALSLWAGISHVRRRRGLRLQSLDLVTILVRDSVVYFFTILAAYVANIVTLTILPQGWNQLPDGFALAVTCIVGCRLVLNIREAYYLPTGDSDSEHVMSEFQTAEPVWHTRPSSQQVDGGIELGPMRHNDMKAQGVIYSTRGPFCDDGSPQTPTAESIPREYEENNGLIREDMHV